jgi:hypothetical protein
VGKKISPRLDIQISGQSKIIKVSFQNPGNYSEPLFSWPVDRALFLGGLPC